MKKILKIIIPSVLMLLLIYLWRDGKDILNGIYIVFPLMYIILGWIYSNKKEVLIGLILLSISFFIPINLYFNMGNCIDLIIIYNILSIVIYLIKAKLKSRTNHIESK